MKKYILGVFALSSLLFSSCEKDNFDEPTSNLTGRIVSKASKGSIGVRQTEGAVQLQLYQDGYELKNVPIPVYVNQDGSFAAKLFDGTYKLITKDNNGPWINDRDTILVQIKGSASVEYSVRPYFMLSNEKFTLSGNTLTATFDIEQENAIQNRNIERVTLYINSTMFVDDSFKLKIREEGKDKDTEGKKDAENPVVGSNTINFDISKFSNFNIIYARIGIKISGVEQLLYTTGSVRVK